MSSPNASHGFPVVGIGASAGGFSGSGSDGTLGMRRIARRLQVHEQAGMSAYLKFVRATPEEIQCLLSDLLITVTNFFRDKETFTWIENKVIPQLFQNKTGTDCVRAWSCGCGTGEEAYSLAMLLHEYRSKHLDPPNCQVFASDINEDAISVARSGFYGESIEVDVSLERLEQFFIKTNHGYWFSSEVANHMRKLPAGDAVIIVALTGWGQERDRIKAKEAGFDSYLTKPPAPQTICDLLMTPRTPVNYR